MAGKGLTGPRAATIKRLFAVSSNECAFPGCTQALYEKGVFVAEICHIKGEKPGAKRHDKSQSDEDRHGFENLIVLCGTHHTIIDQDDKTYTVDRLQDMKRLHEANKQTKFEISDNEADRLALLAGGMTLGTVIGVVAAGLAELFKAVKPAATMPAEEKPHIPHGDDWRPLIHVLERIGPGKIAVAGRRPFPANLGNMFATQFALSGRWQQADPRYYIQGDPPEPGVLMILEHSNPRALEELFPHIERLLSVMGFERINDPKHTAWESEEYGPYVIRFVLVQLRPGQRP